VHTNSPRPSRRGAGLLGAEQIPVGQRRDGLHESLQYWPHFLSYFHIPYYTVIYHTIPVYTSYVEVYHYTEKVQVHLYDSMGTCTISGILCYGTPRYLVLIQVVVFLRGDGGN
jgi:hypothetical protein